MLGDWQAPGVCVSKPGRSATPVTSETVNGSYVTRHVGVGGAWDSIVLTQ
jgi:hypothetical protein